MLFSFTDVASQNMLCWCDGDNKKSISGALFDIMSDSITVLFLINQISVIFLSVTNVELARAWRENRILTFCFCNLPETLFLSHCFGNAYPIESKIQQFLSKITVAHFISA